VAIPHYISEDKSEMRGIKSGWYATEDDGNLSSAVSQPRGMPQQMHSAKERIYAV
jgi:hypothetical protein